MVIECSFGRLKSRFGLLRREMDTNTHHLPYVIHAYFVLRNFCEAKNEKVSEESASAAMQTDENFQPLTTGNILSPGNSDEAGRKKVRNIFVKYFH